MEAATGFEPVSQGFAVPCLTTWLRRRGTADYKRANLKRQCIAQFMKISILGEISASDALWLSPPAEKADLNGSMQDRVRTTFAPERAC